MSCLWLPAHGKYYDLNVPRSNIRNIFAEKLLMLVELGYEVVALTNLWEANAKEHKQTDPNFVVPQPPRKFEHTPQMKKVLQKNNQTLMQLTRLTIELSDIYDVKKVHEAINSKLYDILAVLPHSEELFDVCCTELDIDIITIDGVNKFDFEPKDSSIKAALERGVHFEACYSSMIRDNTVLRILTANVRKCMHLSGGKNLILSSAAMKNMDIRGPRDVANLSTLFGLKENVVIHTISKRCRDVVVHGFCRKTGTKRVKEMPERINLESKLSAVGSKRPLQTEDSAISNIATAVNTSIVKNVSKKKKKKKRHATSGDASRSPKKAKIS